MWNWTSREAGRGASAVLDAETCPTDAELLGRWAASADRSALEVLIRRHGHMVLGVCRRVLGDSPDAEDAFQATFLVLVRRASGLSWPEQVAGWLHGVALRVSQKARVARARRLDRETLTVDPVAPEPNRDTADLRRELDEELDRLPEKYRLPIVLCELEGLTLEQAALRLGWPKGTVAGRLSRGRDLLRRRLTRRGTAFPLWMVGGLAPIPVGSIPSDQLVAATVDSAATPTNPPAPAADTLNRSTQRRRWLSLLLVFALVTGLLAASVWPSLAKPGSDSSSPPAAPLNVPSMPVDPMHQSSCHR